MNSKKTVIFFGGEQGSGKTSAAEYLAKINEQNGSVQITLRFADTIKELHDIIEPKFAAAAGIPAKKKNGTLLQKLGTEVGRHIYGQDIWVKLTQSRIEQIFEASTDMWDLNQVVVVEDVRFENELMLSQTLKEKGYNTTSVYFDCPLEIRKQRVSDFRENTSHQSEAELERIKHMFEYTVRTDGDEKDKFAALNNILKGLGLISSPIDRLNLIVDLFNNELEAWSKSTGHGANFEWRYQPDGTKILAIKDCSEISTLPKDKAAIAVSEVQNFMEKLDE